MSEKDIATAVGCKNTSDLRVRYSRSINEMRADRVSTARSLKSDGLSNAEVARKMGINESTLRSLLNENSEAKMNAAQRTADQLRKLVDEKGMIDVGIGVEREMNISREKMTQALKILEDEGFVWYGGGVPQVTNPGKQTNIKVLCPPGTEHKEIYDFEKVSTVKDYIQRYDENGQEIIEHKFEYPASMDSSRLMVRYRDDPAPDGHTEVIRAMSRNRNYSELIQIPSFEERFQYLRLGGEVGSATFGFDRYLNQRFYHSAEWRSIRDYVIARDNGCDMAMEGRTIFDKIYIHHINPICAKDLELAREILSDPAYLVCVSFDTHNAIHYGTEDLLPKDPIVRRPGDTCPWRS